METSGNIKSYRQDHISIDETDRLKQFKTFIDKTESDQLSDRKNFVAHITGSETIFVSGQVTFTIVRKDFKISHVCREDMAQTTENEEFPVGQSVFFSADALMREDGKLIQYLKCGISVYRRIGRSIASHPLKRGADPAAYDTDPLKRVSAFNGLDRIPDRESVIKESDMLFSATGNKALKIEDFRELKNGCHIFSVTSSDDGLEKVFEP